MGTQSPSQVFSPSFGEPLPLIDLPSPFSRPTDLSPGATSGSHLRETAGGRRKRQRNVLAQGERHRDAATIDMLPDDVLLEIFDVFRMESPYIVWNWHLLVHVCRKWRQIIFASPLRLDLRILCTDGTPVRQNLCIWPRLPIVLIYHYDDTGRGLAPDDEDNVIAALEYPDLVSYLDLNVTSSQLGRISTEMRKPFPELTDLYLNITSLDRNAPVLPPEFLGGSAPSLRTINFWGLPFPALPRLLLSASDVTYLNLYKIPPTGYISPEAMVVGLAALPRLRSFFIEFRLTTPHPDRIPPPPITRTVLPALNNFSFRGASEYLEDLIGRIDSPQLDTVNITYLNQLVDFQVTQLSKFIDRSVAPLLTPFGHAQVCFRNGVVSFNVRHHENHLAREWIPARTDIRCEGIDWQVSHITQLLGQCPATLSTIQHLVLKAEPKGPPLEGMDDAEWRRLLQQFSAVKTLYVSRGLAEYVALALENLALENLTMGAFAGALPSLDLIYLAGQPEISIEKSVATRRLLGHPVTVIDTEAEFKERLKSYAREQEAED